MFEISDDDEEFWEDFPLDSITDQKDRSVSYHTNNGSNKRTKIEEVSTVQKPLVNTIQNPSVISRTQSKQLYTPAENSINVQTNAASAFSFKQNKKISNELDVRGNFGDSGKMTNMINTKAESSSFSSTSNTCGFFTPVKKSQPTKPESSKSTASFSRNLGNHDNSLKENQLLPLKSPGKDDRVTGNGTPVRRVKRKFPGPAGRLPKLRPGQPLEKLTTKSPETDNKLPKTTVMSSQSIDDGFNESSWQTLIDDLGDSADMVLDQFSVFSSLQQASKKILPRGKIPLLLVMVESIDLQGAGASVVLKDKTGRIKGTLHRDVIKEYGADIQAGTTLVLRQVSVVSPTSRSHYVNITRNNVVYLNSNSVNMKKHLFNHKSLTHFINDFQKHHKHDISMTSPCASGQTFNGSMNQHSAVTPNGQMSNSLQGPQFSSSVMPSNVRNQHLTTRFPSNNSNDRFSSCVPLTNSAQKDTTLNTLPKSSMRQSIPGSRSLTSNSFGNARLNPDSKSRATSTSFKPTNSPSVILNQTSGSKEMTANNIPNGNSGISANISSSCAKSNNEQKENQCSSINTFNQRSNLTLSNSNVKGNITGTAGQFKGDNSIKLGTDCQNSTPKTSKFSFKSKTPSFSPKVNITGVTSNNKLSSTNTDDVKFEELWQDDITDELLSHLSEEMI